MLNPFNLPEDSGSYLGLQKRILQRVRSTTINEKIFDLAQKTYEDAVNAEKIVLSRREKKHLQNQILRRAFEDLVNRGSVTADEAVYLLKK
ncbi:MAG: hypothetical protein HY258_03615 [Chloroflexi bacterium]|nr:hypothetical protein [Chloroflexota bacterium]